MKLLVQKSLLLSALMAMPGVFAQDTLSKKQAANYIEHVVKTLFSTIHSGSYAEEIKQFTHETVRALKNQHRTAHELYPLIMDRAINFIEKKSHTYAQRELDKQGRSDSPKAREIAKKIGGEARAVINSSSVLPDNALAPFIGANLSAKVQQLLKSKIKTYKKHTTKQTCPVCYEQFSGYHKKIMLTCGHLICADCLAMLETHKGHVIGCPLCKQSIHVCDYRNYIPVSVVNAPIVTSPVTYTTVSPVVYKPVEIVQPAVTYQAPVYLEPSPSWFSFDFGFKL